MKLSERMRSVAAMWREQPINWFQDNASVWEDTANEVAKLEVGICMLYDYLEKHKTKPHAPVVDEAGIVGCACFGCELAREIIAVFEDEKESSVAASDATRE